MARPKKNRKVCSMPQTSGFAPLVDGQLKEIVTMTIDEYETIRLIDYVGYTQEECAEQMRIARTTVQGIYNDARKKLGDVLVNGKQLSIEGGDIALCDGRNMPCGSKCQCFCSCNKEENQDGSEDV